MRQRHVGGILGLLLIIWLSAPTRADALPVDLLAGAKTEYAVIVEDKAPQWQDEIILDDKRSQKIMARISFNVANPAAHKLLALNSSADVETWMLNGGEVTVPVKGMRYQKINSIPATLLKKGSNVLQATLTIPRSPTNRPDITRFQLAATLIPQTEKELAIHTGPIVGASGADYLAISFRTTLPAAATLKLGDKTLSSPVGVHHQFRVEGLKPGTSYEYRLSATLAESGYRVSSGPHTTRTLSNADRFVFAAVGDNRSGPKIWGDICKAIIAHKPEFLLHLGDMVPNGRSDAQWDVEFWGPAKALCASMPLFVTYGNHEESAPILNDLFAAPGGKKNWLQRIGSLMLISIDGAQSFDSDSDNGKWLRETLVAGKDAKFIFLITHYPAWSSSYHGNTKRMQKVLAVMEKHKASAMLAGHAHCYEKSDPGNGTLMIVTGGGGSPLHKKDEKKPENPHSKVYVADYNYLIFNVDGDTCSMKAYDLAGKEIDSCIFKAIARN